MDHTLLHFPQSGAALPGWTHGPTARQVRPRLQAPLFALLDQVAPAQVTGRHRLPDAGGPVIFAANHTSHLDSPVLLRALPPQWRARVAVAAAEDYFVPGSWRGLAAELLFNTFPVSRTAGRRTLTACADRLAAGWSLLIYPEGTRSRTGELGVLQGGVGLLAARSGVPVVPVYLGGVYAVLPKGRSVPRPGPVQVCFGPPLRFAPDTRHEVVTAALAAALRHLAAGVLPLPVEKGGWQDGRLWA